MRWLALFALLLSAEVVSPASTEIGGGSVICVFLYQAGVIVAVDSRTTLFDGTHCDNQDKIFTVENHPLSLLVMTGNYTITTAPGELTGCAFLNSKVYEVDFRRTMKQFLSQSKQPLTQKRLKQAERILKTEIEGQLPRHPQLVDKDQGIVSVMVVEKIREGTLFGSFKIVSPDRKQGAIAEDTFHLIKNNDPELDNAHITGSGDCVTLAWSADGRKYLSVDALKTYDAVVTAKPTIGQMKQEDAIKMAREIISSVITISNRFPKLGCKVGGPINLYDLNDQKVVRLN